MIGRQLTVAELFIELAAALYERRLGYLTVEGTLTDWRRHRYGSATGELSDGTPPRTQLRIHANRHTADTIETALADAGHDPATPARVTASGQIVLHARWGLQLDTHRIDLTKPPKLGSMPTPTVHNRDTRWPQPLDTIALIDPADGNDGRSDILAVLDPLDLTVIEYRVPVNGDDAAWRITRALDKLAADPRPQLTLLIRGGDNLDLTPFNDDAVTAAIARHPRPVITGIGHATNTTAADQAAAHSAITPTAAAQVVREHVRTRKARATSDRPSTAP